MVSTDRETMSPTCLRSHRAVGCTHSPSHASLSQALHPRPPAIATSTASTASAALPAAAPILLAHPPTTSFASKCDGHTGPGPAIIARASARCSTPLASPAAAALASTATPTAARTAALAGVEPEARWARVRARRAPGADIVTSPADDVAGGIPPSASAAAAAMAVPAPAPTTPAALVGAARPAAARSFLLSPAAHAGLAPLSSSPLPSKTSPSPTPAHRAMPSRSVCDPCVPPSAAAAAAAAAPSPPPPLPPPRPAAGARVATSRRCRHSSAACAFPRPA